MIKSEVKYNFSWVCMLYIIKLTKNSMVGGALAAISLDLVLVAAKAPTTKPLNQMGLDSELVWIASLLIPPY